MLLRIVIPTLSERSESKGRNLLLLKRQLKLLVICFYLQRFGSSVPLCLRGEN